MLCGQLGVRGGDLRGLAGRVYHFERGDIWRSYVVVGAWARNWGALGSFGEELW